MKHPVYILNVHSNLFLAELVLNVIFTTYLTFSIIIPIYVELVLVKLILQNIFITDNRSIGYVKKCILRYF